METSDCIIIDVKGEWSMEVEAEEVSCVSLEKVQFYSVDQ